MATATVSLALNQSTFLAGMARARASVSALGSSVGQIGTRGFVAAGAAVVAFGTATAVGIKKAFDFGGQLADMSAISGRSVKEILLLRRALEDAGVSMEKIDRYILTGQDRGQVIARALKNMSEGDWIDAAKSVGKQAEILDKNAATFDRVSDLLNRSGSKLMGFFVGVADVIGKALLPILEKFDKLDFAAQGEKFGAALLTGAQALAGFFQKPEVLFGVMFAYLRAGILGIGNVLVAVFKTGLEILQNGMQAAFEMLSSPNKSVFNFQIAAKKTAQKLFGTNMAGLNSYGKGLQKDIDILTEQSKGASGPSFSDRMAQITKERGTNIKVEDIFDARGEMKAANAGVADMARFGKSILPSPAAAPGRQLSAEEQAKAGEAKLAASQSAADLAVSKISFSNFGSGMSGLNEDFFKQNKANANAEVDAMWGTPKPAAGPAQSKGDTLLEKVVERLDKQNNITEAAWK